MQAISLEERFALQDLMTAYCYAVDDLGDLQSLLDLFTDDAVLDFSAIGLPAMEGKVAFRGFYESVFADMTHHTHYLSNFRIDSFGGDTAALRAYAEGLGRSREGNSVHVHVRYRMKAVRTGGSWKISRYEIHPGMPMPGSLEEIHGER